MSEEKKKDVKEIKKDVASKENNKKTENSSKNKKTEKQKKVVLIYEEDQIADAIRYAENLRKTYKTALYIKPKKLGKFLNKLEEQGFDGFQVFGRDEEVRMFGK